MSGRPKIANGRLGDVAPFRCGTAPGLCVSTCMLVVGGRHRGRTLCIWHPLGVGGLQPLRSAIGAAQSYFGKEREKGRDRAGARAFCMHGKVHVEWEKNEE